MKAVQFCFLFKISSYRSFFDRLLHQTVPEVDGERNFPAKDVGVKAYIILGHIHATVSQDFPMQCAGEVCLGGGRKKWKGVLRKRRREVQQHSQVEQRRVLLC